MKRKRKRRATKSIVTTTHIYIPSETVWYSADGSYFTALWNVLAAIFHRRKNRG